MQPVPAPAPTSPESNQDMTSRSSHAESDITRISFKEGIDRLYRDKEILSKADSNAKDYIHSKHL